MSTPVVTSKWAGNFDCTVCRRKRLMAEEFSKSSLDKYRKTGQALRCKDCTAKQEQEKRALARGKTGEERTTASSSTVTADDDRNEKDEKRTCAGPCHKNLTQDSYNRNQWSKPEGKGRCRDCVERSIQEDSAQQKNSKDDKIEKARKKVQDLTLSKTATAQQIVAAESELAAVEAEKVTGLKPIRLGGRGGGNRRSGRGHGRGASRGGAGRGTIRSGRSTLRK